MQFCGPLMHRRCFPTMRLCAVHGRSKRVATFVKLDSGLVRVLFMSPSRRKRKCNGRLVRFTVHRGRVRGMSIGRRGERTLQFCRGEKFRVVDQSSLSDVKGPFPVLRVRLGGVQLEGTRPRSVPAVRTAFRRDILGAYSRRCATPRVHT